MNAHQKHLLKRRRWNALLDKLHVGTVAICMGATVISSVMLFSSMYNFITVGLPRKRAEIEDKLKGDPSLAPDDFPEK